MEAGLVADHTLLWEATRDYRPTLFGGLPRFYEKSYEALQAEQRRAAGAERQAWDRTVELGLARSRLRQAQAPVPPELEEEWRRVGTPFFARAAERFGGRARRFTSGGAALPREVAEYLDALGIPVLGAYGLTEHLCVAMNRPGAYRFDSAGPPMPGTEIALAPDGEVMVRRGPLSFSGYRGRPEESAAAFTPDGWLLTGDLGELGADGSLRITGRKKELIALSTGKKVAPLPIESALADEPWISQAMLYGEGRSFISALLALRPAMLAEWRGQGNGHGNGEGNGHPASTGDGAGFLRHPELLAQVQAAVDRVNAGLSRTEQVRRFLVLDRELSAEAGELTPTLKLRREAVTARFGAELDALYPPREP
jgi:long-chain acyl-CoA synthetase